MSDSYKPGGGNKPQPYIPAGNGEKSGEYTDKPVSSKKPGIKTASSVMFVVYVTFSIPNA